MKLNLAPMLAAHRFLLADHDRMITVAGNAAAEIPQKHVRNNPDGFKHRTGRLTRATSGRFVRLRGRGGVVLIKNTARHARALNDGSGLFGPSRQPYVIAPRRKRALRFMVGGREVFTRRVLHPGIRPTHFLFKSAQATHLGFGRRLEDGIEEVARRFNRR